VVGDEYLHIRCSKCCASQHSNMYCVAQIFTTADPKKFQLSKNSELIKVNQIGECDVTVPSAAFLQNLFVYEENDFEFILFKYTLLLWRTANNLWV